LLPLGEYILFKPMNKNMAKKKKPAIKSQTNILQKQTLKETASD
jgi:hypothetical protein